MLPRAIPRVLVAAACSFLVMAIPGSARASIPDVDPVATTNLGWNGYRSMLVDAARSQLILSGSNAGGGELKFVTFSGSVTSTITGVAAGDMVIDGSTLYILSPDDGTIRPVNLATKTVGAAITSSVTGSQGLGYAGGYLWTNGFDTGLQRVNKTTGAITSYKGTDFPEFAGSVFATNPVDPNELAVASQDVGSGTARIYDVSAFPPTVVASQVLGVYAQDIRYTPDGSTVLLGEHGLTEFSSTDLTEGNSYPTGGSISADAADVGGVFVAEGAYSTPKVEVYPEGQSTPNFTGTLYGGGVFAEVGARGGVRFSPTGDRLFVVTHAPAFSPDEYYLQVFADPTHFGASTTIAGPSEVSVLTAIDISGVLTYADGVPVDPGEQIDIQRRIGAASDEPVGSTTTTTGGAWSFEYPTTVDDIGTLTLTATFPGNSMHRGTSAETAVTVDRIQPTLSLTVSKKAITVGDKVAVSVHLGLDGSEQDHRVAITGTVAGTTKSIGVVTVNDAGDGSLVLKPSYTTTFQAKSTADSLHAAVDSTGKRVGVRCIVTGTLTGSYATRHGIHLFHTGVNPKYTVHVDPNETHFPIVAYLDIHKSGRWVKVQYSQFELQKGSKIVLIVNGAKLKRGVVYRISASFKSGRNLLDRSPWTEFEVP